eukprot:CAMPEP_0197711170 /NCGR_PEP_ID=MMETSP1338-20131121/129321_1 /TAXON_ID=43686 ORGANISM="Pelagodinium beii, Strain RCC1491" /NCGR_SAMPLE_ID=MMETSP1338 /ASSEMBLY_ACC=CAM_ASM_000754 /LENGTH=59 /DNA_ID=CAMNT_0043295103 /DNA_START=677 /DNA_END=856 /DNA_ORIENTATION=+
MAVPPLPQIRVASFFSSSCPSGQPAKPSTKPLKMPGDVGDAFNTWGELSSSAMGVSASV